MHLLGVVAHLLLHLVGVVAHLLLHLLGVVAHFVLVDGAVMAHVSVVGHDEDGNVRRNTRQFALDVIERPGAQVQTHRA